MLSKPKNFSRTISRTAARPIGLLVILLSIAWLVGAIWILRTDRDSSALFVTLPLLAIILVLIWHSLRVTNAIKRLEKSLKLRSLEWEEVSQAVSRLSASPQDADLYAGRAVAENLMRIESLETRVSSSECQVSELRGEEIDETQLGLLDARLAELELGFDRAGRRISAIENNLRPAVKKTSVGTTQDATIDPKHHDTADR